MNYKNTQQYIVTFKDEFTVKLLEKLGKITFKSPVVNILFMDTDKSKKYLTDIKGVMSVTYPKNGRLLSHKK